MPGQWSRVALAGLPPGEVLQPGGMMLMATTAKKHLTIFARSRRAPGAGSPEIKAEFTAAARQTRGIFSRQERNAEVARSLAGLKGRSGPHYRRSRSKVHLGQRYQIGATGYGGMAGGGTVAL